MIALPLPHPSNVYEIDTLNQNLTDILREIEIESERVAHGKAKLSLLDKVENGRLKVQQGLSRAVGGKLKRHRGGECTARSILWQ